MRQIYTSPRMENVERVVALLDAADIATSITNRRAYAGSDYKRFSYSARGDRDSWPIVWIVRAEDQPRARELLRAAGIEPPTRFADELAAARGADAGRDGPARLALRLRLVLLVAIVLVILLMALNHVY